MCAVDDPTLLHGSGLFGRADVDDPAHYLFELVLATQVPITALVSRTAVGRLAPPSRPRIFKE